MDRRTTIKGLAAGTIGLMAFAYWAKDWSVLDEETTYSYYSDSELSTLTALTDTIIPKGNSIGALDVGTDKFLEKLFERCYERDIQENIKNQLTTLEISAKDQFGSLYADCSQKEREDLFLSLSKSENENEKDFFNLMKSQTIRGFKTSKTVMLDYLNYEIAPGRYNGCVNVNALS